ncbi:MAG: DUF167 domain-containing protein [Gemmatimonadota bacterium]
MNNSHAQPPSCKLAVKVAPGSSANGIQGWLGETLKVRVTAAPERGKANAATLKVLARALGVRPRSLRIVDGATSQRKIVQVEGLTEAEIHHRLERATSRSAP